MYYPLLFLPALLLPLITEKGFTQVSQRVKMTIMAGRPFLPFGYLWRIVYLGATSGYPVTDDLSRTKLFLHISNSY
jgi:LIVCS family branched-chain amino acid:cation transporter